MDMIQLGEKKKGDRFEWHLLNLLRMPILNTEPETDHVICAFPR